MIKWGRRLLYLLLFISFFVVYGSLGDPITYTFLGSMICLVIPVLFFLKDDSSMDID